MAMFCVSVLPCVRYLHTHQSVMRHTCTAAMVHTFAQAHTRNIAGYTLQPAATPLSHIGEPGGFKSLPLQIGSFSIFLILK